MPENKTEWHYLEDGKFPENYKRVLITVLDDEGKPWADVWVWVESKSRMGDGTATDSTGHFAFWISPTDETLAANDGFSYVSKSKITDTPITIRMKRSR